MSDRLYQLTHLGITLLVGVVGVVAGRFWLSADVERQTDVQFVNMAIGILAEEVTDPVQQAPLREWAIEVINEHSAVQITGEAKARLLEEALALEWDASRTSFNEASRAWNAAEPAKQEAEQAAPTPE